VSGTLAGQVAVVTGGSRGIGRAIATRLAGDGAHVVVNFRENTSAAAETVRAIEQTGGAAETAQFDVADAEATQQALGALIERLGRCDILVNNAGLVADALLVRMKAVEWDRVLAVNLGGTFNCTKAVTRAMLRARYGRVINMSSIVAAMGNAGQAVYAATKAGIIGFTKSLARELASRAITVNAVAPGFIETDMTANLPEPMRSEYVKLIPVGRLGTAEEIAEAVAFLAHPGCGYITGQVLAVNGGLYM